MSVTWNTKWGKRRVKVELPTLDEAFFAAEAMTDNLEQRIEIAASLMGLPVAEVRLKAGQALRRKTITAAGPRGAPGRAVVVERKIRRTFTRAQSVA